MKENLQNKANLVTEIKDKLSKAKTVVFVDYKGINVVDDTKLRSEFRKNNDDYKVYKNRLMLRALNELGYTGFDSYLEGTTAFAFGYEDEVSAAKVVTETAKTNKNLVVKCGIMNGKFMDKAEVEKLGNLPNKETLIAQLLCVLNGPARNLACTLKAVVDKEQA
ncbi:MAG: 50S ribosomal protein L10 [Clostridiales bacterium]|nr:50S ribosomal protein L10 [Clostridiales bacterium]